MIIILNKIILIIYEGQKVGIDQHQIYQFGNSQIMRGDSDLVSH